MKKTNWIFGIVIVLIIGGLVSLLVVEAKKPGKYDTLAQCIADSGAKFYGAFWCPHCAAQKALFGDAVKELPYHECSTPDGNGQLPDCDAAGVTNYPTWVFPDHSTSTGEVPLATLATKTSFTLPAN